MKIKNILSTQTFKHSFISFGGTLATGLLGLVFYVFAARQLGKADYGVFSLSVTTMALISSIANFGIDTGILRFVSESNKSNPTRAFRFLKLALEAKLVTWFILLFLGWIFMPFIVQTFFGKAELVMPFRVALFGVGGMLLSSFSLSALQAYSKFGWWSVLNVFSNLVRLGLIVFLFASGTLATISSLWIYGGVLFLLFFVCLLFLPNFWSVRNEYSVWGEFVKFNKWVALFTAIAAVGSRLDTYIGARYLSLSEVGTYAVGVSLVSFVTQIVLALGSVVAPKLTTIKDKKSAILYLKKLQLFVLVLGVLGLAVGIPLGAIFIPLIYGSQYINSVLPFSILLVGQAIFLLSVPIHMAVLYYFSHPKLFVYITLSRMLMTLVLGLILIPQYGAVGASITALIGNITDLLIPGIWVIIRLSK